MGANGSMGLDILWWMLDPPRLEESQAHTVCNIRHIATMVIGAPKRQAAQTQIGLTLPIHKP